MLQKNHSWKEESINVASFIVVLFYKFMEMYNEINVTEVIDDG